MTTVSDVPSCGITYDHYSDNSRGVIYNCNIFVVHATDVFDDKKRSWYKLKSTSLRYLWLGAISSMLYVCTTRFSCIYYIYN